jgi:hypothetical protein
MLSLIAQAIGPGSSSTSERSDKLSLVKFILTHFNIREEEMITVHAPLTALSILCMLEEAEDKGKRAEWSQSGSPAPTVRALTIAADLIELVPERAFRAETTSKTTAAIESTALAAIPNVELLEKIRTFYMNDQGNLDVTLPPFASQNVAELLLQKACNLNCESLLEKQHDSDLGVKSRILMFLLSKTGQKSSFDVKRLLYSLRRCLSTTSLLPFANFSSTLPLAIHLYSTNRISAVELSDLVDPLVRHAWSFLSASEPKYHVETVRNLWQLQTALTPQCRDVEAAICALMIADDTNGTYAVRPADSGRRFGVLWSHTMQDNPSGSERKASKSPNGDIRPSRLAGIDNYDAMLTRPLFLMLDALIDERTQLFMTVKAWLSSLVGIDK